MTRQPSQDFRTRLGVPRPRQNPFVPVYLCVCLPICVWHRIHNTVHTIPTGLGVCPSVADIKRVKVARNLAKRLKKAGSLPFRRILGLTGLPLAFLATRPSSAILFQTNYLHSLLPRSFFLVSAIATIPGGSVVGIKSNSQSTNK